VVFLPEMVPADVVEHGAVFDQLRSLVRRGAAERARRELEAELVTSSLAGGCSQYIRGARARTLRTARGSGILWRTARSWLAPGERLLTRSLAKGGAAEG